MWRIQKADPLRILRPGLPEEIVLSFDHQLGRGHQHLLLIGCTCPHSTVTGPSYRVADQENCFISSFVPPWSCLIYWFWVYSWIGNNPLRRNNQNNEPSWSPLKCSFWFQQLLSSWTVRVCVCLLNTGIEREDQTREASLRSLSVHIQGNVCTLLALTHTTLKIQRRVGG